MEESLYKIMVRSLVLAANNIITLGDNAVYEGVQPQLQTLARALSDTHAGLMQLEQVMPNTGFEFGKQTVENDILDYARLLHADHEELAEVADYYLSGGLQDYQSLTRASHLAEVLNSVIDNSYTICQIL